MQISELQKKTIELLNPWWLNQKIELGVIRNSYLLKIDEISKKRKQILFVLGSRRVGKTRILTQFIYKLIDEGIEAKKILFLSLDNSNLERLDLYSFLAESSFEYVFLDEVHQFSDWERILKSLYDLPIKKFKIICSGSSSRLIEDNKAFLTGRNTNLNIYPLDFNEFLYFSKTDNINDYLFYGGYPEYVLEKEPSYLNDLLRDIIEKDIVKIHKIKNTKYLFDVLQILAKQVGYKSSSNKVAKVLDIDNKTVDSLLTYFKEVKLIESINQYSDSLNKKLYSPKKYYFNDLGMRNSFTGLSDKGSLVENAIFLKLSRTFGVDNIYYLSDVRGQEVDFVVDLGEDRVLLIESKYNNLQYAIENSLSKVFFKEIHNKKITERIVVTDGVDGIFEKENLKIKLISLENFLKNELNIS